MSAFKCLINDNYFTLQRNKKTPIISIISSLACYVTIKQKQEYINENLSFALNCKKLMLIDY